MATKTSTDELADLERESWKALVTDGAASPFYDRVLAKDVLMLMPGGMVIDDRQTVVDAMKGAPWSSYELGTMHVFALGDDSAVVWYSATAVRGDHTYKALFNSTYVRESGEWRLALHQQTPDESRD
jgi:hypothetical protein